MSLTIGNHKLKLSSYCTVYQAELLAICKAVELAARGRDTQDAIISDSRSALETIINNNTLHPLAINTRASLEKANRNKGQQDFLSI